jgi:hypothetical protein
MGNIFTDITHLEKCWMADSITVCNGERLWDYCKSLYFFIAYSMKTKMAVLSKGNHNDVL